MNCNSIKNHYLSSITPFQTVPHPKQITKSRQFYKPQQFIWNNPHRTSKRIYPYYHKVNDNYTSNLKPKIDEMIEQDRINSENQRIRRLSEQRKQVRRKFHSRQQIRQCLQNKTHSRAKQFSQIQVCNKNSQSYLNKSNYLSPKAEKQYLTITQKSYNKSINEFDANLQKIQKLFTQQIQQNQSKIRHNFKKRKQHNDLISSRIRQSKTYQFNGSLA